MRKLRVIEFLSLDGVMQGPGSPEEDTEGGFEHGGWAPPYQDEVLAKRAVEGMSATDAYLFGRKTYEKMAAYWPTAPREDPIADHLNRTPKFIASNTLEDAEWENSTVLQGDVVQEVRRLKQLPGGNIAVLGSGDLVQTLIKHDLVDEYFLTVYPLLLGNGKRLFQVVDQPTRLRLVDSKSTTTGGVILTYSIAE